MNKVEGAVTLGTIADQCVRMSENERLDTFIWYFGNNGIINVTVNLDADYDKEDGQGLIYNNLDKINPSFAEILKDLIAIEVEYTEKQTALDEARFP